MQKRKKYSTPWGTLPIKKVRPEEASTMTIYYGGKSRDVEWIIKNLPHGYTTVIDLFGGGAAFTSALVERHLRRLTHMGHDVVDTSLGGRVFIYNDIGNVANFYMVVRDYGEELYYALYHTPFSREEFDKCAAGWQSQMLKAWESNNSKDYIEWARMWFTTINQGYSHAEIETSWHVAKQVNSARALSNHVESIPYFVEQFRYVHIEHKDFRKVLDLYDKGDAARKTLWYCDPPYVSDTRVSLGTYQNEMSLEVHKELLDRLKSVSGQVVLSGYHSELYDSELKGWRTVEKTSKSAIQNSSQLQGRGERTEVLWVREHNNGLWSQGEPADVAGVQV